MSTRCSAAFFPRFDLARTLSAAGLAAGWRGWRDDIARIRRTSRSELRASFGLLAEMFHRGGLLTAIEPDGGGGLVTIRLLLQPDGDALVKLDVAHTADSALPPQVQHIVAGLVADLSSAQRSIHALRRMLNSGVSVLLGSLAAGGISAAPDLIVQVVIGASLLSVGAALRFLRGAALSWVLRRAARSW